MEFCNLKAQYHTYKNEIDNAIASVIDSTQFIGGSLIQDFEKSLSTFTGSHAVTCANGTDALQIALIAAGVKSGDEVITTPFTFIATAEVIAIIGATPIFVDVDPVTFNIDPVRIESVITEKTSAIIPVSLFGQPSDMDAINSIAKKYSLVVIEDGAQSFGAQYKGVRSGNLSPIATTSFFPAKPLGCYGDGGALFCQDTTLINRVNQIKNHGQAQRYHHSIIGINSRLDTLQAAILNVKLNHYSEELIQRQRIADYYTELLQSYPVITPKLPANRTSAWAQYTIRSSERDTLKKRLMDSEIPIAVHYPIPLHLQEAFAYLGHTQGDFPIAEQLSQEVLSLPMSAFITPAEQEQVISAFDR
ncbi:MAG: DegT/DnrJ/EryC1/StrS family aminotransferase [Fibrobacterales bacterium]